jgi:hypothetical protein
MPQFSINSILSTNNNNGYGDGITSIASESEHQTHQQPAEMATGKSRVLPASSPSPSQSPPAGPLVVPPLAPTVPFSPSQIAAPTLGYSLNIISPFKYSFCSRIANVLWIEWPVKGMGQICPF